jgi:hypothetical protein
MERRASYSPFACGHAERMGGDARSSTIEIEFHFLKAYFCARKRQDRLLRLWMTQTISSTSKYA